MRLSRGIGTNLHRSLVKGSPRDISFPNTCPCPGWAEQTQTLEKALAKSCRCWILALEWGAWGTSYPNPEAGAPVPPFLQSQDNATRPSPCCQHCDLTHGPCPALLGTEQPDKAEEGEEFSVLCKCALDTWAADPKL